MKPKTMLTRQCTVYVCWVMWYLHITHKTMYGTCTVDYMILKITHQTIYSTSMLGYMILQITHNAMYSTGMLDCIIYKTMYSTGMLGYMMFTNKTQNNIYKTMYSMVGYIFIRQWVLLCLRKKRAQCMVTFAYILNCSLGPLSHLCDLSFDFGLQSRTTGRTSRFPMSTIHICPTSSCSHFKVLPALLWSDFDATWGP